MPKGVEQENQQAYAMHAPRGCRRRPRPRSIRIPCSAVRRVRG